MTKRLLAYLLGITVLFLSKTLVPLVLYALTRVWDLPDQFVTFCLSKGPPFVDAMIFVLLGLHLLLSPREVLIGWPKRNSEENVRKGNSAQFKGATIEKKGESLNYTRIAGGLVLGLGIVVLYLTFTGKATAGYGARSWPPLPYP